MKCPKCGGEIFDMGRTVSEVLHDDKIPEGAKNLMIPILQRLKLLETQWTGAIELAYMRGKQEGQETNSDS